MSPFTTWLREGRRFGPAGLAIVSVVALALALPLPEAQRGGQTSALGGTQGSTPGDPSSEGLVAGAAPGAAGAQGSAGAAGGGSGSAPAATGSGAGVGGRAAGGVPPVPDQAGADASYQGVTATTVKWGYAAQQQSCGGISQSQQAALYGGSANPSVDYQVAEAYFNGPFLSDHAFPPGIREHVNPKSGYWGRRITSVFRDSGGVACQDVGRASAVAMAEQDKVFGIVMRGNEGPEIPMSLVMAQHKLVFVGRQNTGPLWFRQRAPYFWDGMWGTGVDENLALSSWVCRDWAGRRATDTGDVNVSGKPRVFGILNYDDPDSNALATLAQRELGRCGVAAKKYTFPADIQNLEANAQTVISRMRADGVTTVYAGVLDFITPLFLTQAATNQAYHPEWLKSGWGLGGFGVEYRTFFTPDQAKNAWAAAEAPTPHHIPFEKTEAYLAFKKIRPNEEPSGDFPALFYEYKVAALGMAGAGRNLTPTTFAEGLARLCNPCPRTDPLQPLQRLGPGKYTHLSGFTLVKYNPDKPDPTAPKDASGNAPMGYFDFLEGGRRYGLRITDPDR